MGTTSPLLQFPPGVLVTGVYMFTLAVSKGVSGGRIPYHHSSASASVTVLLLPGAAPTISIDTSVLPTNKTQPRAALHAEWHGGCARIP